MMIVTPAKRNTGAAIGLLLGSYVLAGLVNATPLTQPALKGTHGRSRVVVIVPPTAEEAAAHDEAASEPGARPVIADRTAQKSI